ncbi:MAG TPA: amino acid adenylation domain-containing protein [Pseudonocardiaceae bacterium]|nr:amino acid adenylation domain-containing protein [Pseudonocardiaceae bacterium]
MTVVELLKRHAQSCGVDRAFAFVDGLPDRPVWVNYAELDSAARRIAAAVISRGETGRPVLLLYPPGRSYVEGFLGCLYAGAIAVPAYPPDPARLDRTLPRLRALIADCGARLALSESWLILAASTAAASTAAAGTAAAGTVAAGSVAPGLDWLATDTPPADPPAGPSLPRVTAQTPALLQYTSGSTGSPKGVLLDHGNLMHNASLVRGGFGTSSGEVGLSWLPPYHDMGLIGGILQPLYVRMPTVLMSPLEFLRRPIGWLEAISRYGVTMSGGPNFAYDLCVRKSTASQRAALDLSRWSLAFCGAEPVRAQTLDRFASAFAVAGFRPEAFYPCYGLAEATLIVTGGRPRLVRNGDAEHVSCGRVLGDQHLAVIDPATSAPCPPGAVGEIVVSGPSVARGYWGRPLDEAVVDGRRYLRTGDLGFLDSGELVVTGRLKDVIVIRGRNVHPQDLEHAIEQEVAGVRPGCTAAFALDVDGAERVAVACEVSGASPVDSVVAGIRRVLAASAEVNPVAVVLLEPRRIPKTSSGKIQRHACREALLGGQWSAGVVARWDESGALVGGAPADPVQTLLSQLASAPNRDEPVSTALALDSLRAVELKHALDEHFGLDIPLSHLLGTLTLRDLSTRVSSVPVRMSSVSVRELHVSVRESSASDHELHVPERSSSGPVGEVNSSEGQSPVPGLEPRAMAAAAGGDTSHETDGARRRTDDTRSEADDTQRRTGDTRSEADDSRTETCNSRTETDDTRHRTGDTRSGADGARRRTGDTRTETCNMRTETDDTPWGVGEGERGLWFLERMAASGRAHHITRAVRIRSALDVERLERAFTELVRRHPALRSCLPEVRGEPVWRVVDFAEPVLRRRAAEGVDERELRRLVLQDAERPFDLERGPLLRVTLYTATADDHVLLLSVHHVVSDFWSLSVLVDDLLALYAGNGPTGRPAVVRPGGRVDQGRLGYWRRVLDGAPAALELPTRRARPRVPSLHAASQPVRLEPGTVAALDAFAAGAGVTRFVTLLAGFAAVLARYAGNDVVVGTPTAGREDRRTARSIGYFVTPVPLRLRPRAEHTFRELVGQARQAVLGALDNLVPFGRLVEAVRPPRDPGRSPVMQAMLTLQQAPPGLPDLGAFAVADETARLRLGPLDVQPYRLDDGSTTFDVALTLAETGGGLSGSLEYGADLFEAPAMAGLVRQFNTLLSDALTRPDTPLGALETMDRGERAAMLALADGGAVPRPEPGTLPGQFERQVAARPQATAVVCGERRLSYAELDRRAGRLAATLRERYGVRRGDLVGVLLPRHEDAVVAFWAVLKAGAGYVPLEPRLPRRRLQWLVAEARPRVLLAHAAMAPIEGEPPRLCLDEPPIDDDGQPVTGCPEVAPGDLAYVIYTSGSTGRPKGVLVPHLGAGNAVRAEAASVGLSAADRVAYLASCAYDVSILEITIAHLHGATLVIAPPEATLPGRELVRFLREQRINVANLPPSLLNALPDPALPDSAFPDAAFPDAAFPDAALPDLRALLVGGEPSTAKLVERWASRHVFVNAYGPTETSISAALDACRPDGERPAIGRPLPNVRTYVLDDRLEPVAQGMPGELFVGGAGVAIGYLGRPDLTAERFLPDPFTATPGARLYRTGDLARWLPDGRLDLLGRVDDQVQVRGVRVEPGEVTAALRELFSLRDAAVVPRPSPGGTELVAYLVADGPRPAVADLRAALRAQLPEPFVPAAFVYLDELPLNASHKLDRAALPAPQPADRGLGDRLAPRTELERTVARVWADVLGHESIGVRDHFFDELGGSSLQVARVTGELGERLGIEVPVTHLFEHPTVEALARRLDGATPDGATPDDAGPDPDDYAAARRRALARRTRRGR